MALLKDRTNRVQTPIRLYESDYKRIKDKVVQDKLTFQKLVEVLLLEYVKGNKEMQKIVNKFADENNAKKRRYVLDDVESNELLRMIEENYSPLRLLENAANEVNKEDKKT